VVDSDGTPDHAPPEFWVGSVRGEEPRARPSAPPEADRRSTWTLRAAGPGRSHHQSRRKTQHARSKTHPPSKIRKHTHRRRASPRQMQPERRRRNRDDEIQTPKIAGSESSDGHSDGDAHRFQRRKPKKKKEKYVM
jgi:hypothetical protein